MYDVIDTLGVQSESKGGIGRWIEGVSVDYWTKLNKISNRWTFLCNTQDVDRPAYILTGNYGTYFLIGKTQRPGQKAIR